MLNNDIELAAKECANNHSKFSSFAWHDEPENSKNFFIFYTSNRDSGLREKSNESVFHKELLKFEDDVHTESHNHWAVGYVDCLIIKVYNLDGSITEAFKQWHELACCLEQYAVLSDDDYSRREYEATLENIKSEAPRGVNLPDDWEQAVFSWLWNNKQSALQNRDDQGGWPSQEEVYEALTAVGIKWEEDDDEG